MDICWSLGLLHERWLLLAFVLVAGENAELLLCHGLVLFLSCVIHSPIPRQIYYIKNYTL